MELDYFRVILVYECKIVEIFYGLSFCFFFLGLIYVVLKLLIEFSLLNQYKIQVMIGRDGDLQLRVNFKIFKIDFGLLSMDRKLLMN